MHFKVYARGGDKFIISIGTYLSVVVEYICYLYKNFNRSRRF